jgi:hypothetical protein
VQASVRQDHLAEAFQILRRDFQSSTFCRQGALPASNTRAKWRKPRAITSGDDTKDDLLRPRRTTLRLPTNGVGR